MPITASRFFAQFKDLKSRIETGTPSPELEAAFHRLVDAFKSVYSADTLKQALAADEPIPSELEERFTSTLVLHHRERSLGNSHTAPPAGEDDS